MKKLEAVAGVVLLGVVGAAQAAEWDLALGLETGGDDLLEVTFTNGDTTSIKAGDGLVLSAGLSTPLNAAGTVQLSGSLGWKFKAVVADNGEARLSRFPLEVVMHYVAGKHRFGAGLARDLAIDFSGDGVLSAVDADLESDVGYLLKYDYALTDHMLLGARFKALTYTADGFSEEIDAGSAGIQLTGRF